MTENCSIDPAWAVASNARSLVAVDPGIGNIRLLRFDSDGRSIVPLHTAPWIDEPGVKGDSSIAPVERQLAGDFLCAPFVASDVEEAPPHGWSANSDWTVMDAAEGGLTLTLQRPVMGARIEKRLRLSADAPILYQEHRIIGGHNSLTVAHHPMFRIAGSARLSVSPKRRVVSESPPEPGRNRLAGNAASDDPTRFPAAAGGTVDLTVLPIGNRHEDFVTMVEAPETTLGWTALVRDEEDDVIFVLKDPGVLPVTMFWHSNGGRDYSPWNGRHTGVLGIEDGCAAGAAGHAAALRPNAISEAGVPTALPLDEGRTHIVTHAIGAVARPPGWSRIADVTLADGNLTISDVGGAVLVLPFDPDFFAAGA